MEKRLSIKDIARKCETSITTVSFVLNGKGKEKKISKAMTDKILAMIAELGYQPHSIAQGLRTGKSKTIGFLVDDISEPFYSGIAKFIDEKASRRGYKILFCCTGKDLKKTSEVLSVLSNRQIDGYIIAFAQGSEELISNLLLGEIPVVLFDSYLPEVASDYVIVNNAKSSYDATRHLIENGFSRIAYVCPDIAQAHMEDRLMGYCMAMRENSNEPQMLKVSDPDHLDSSLFDFLGAYVGPNALLFGTNYLTMQAIRVIAAKDPAIFRKVGMVSFDDFELLKFLPVPMTAVEQPVEEIAEAIIDIMLAKLSHSHIKGKFQRLISTKLNVRQSSRAR